MSRFEQLNAPGRHCINKQLHDEADQESDARTIYGQGEKVNGHEV
jgi:hypothetical protein